MESKTKHRILGIMVVAGIAVLMYPFMVGTSSMPNEHALVMAPPFPDQATQIASAMSDDVINMTAATDEMVLASTEQDSKFNQQPDPAANQANPDLTNVSSVQPSSDTKAKTEPKVQTKTAETSLLESDIKPAKIKAIQRKISAKPAKKLVRLKKHTLHARRQPLAVNKNTPIGNNGLLELKQAAYVIQLGSFSKKTNALKLVNKLRANGYRAFIQNVDLSSGQNIRVFVGPEHRQASARQMATDLEKEMKLRGIVIRYQPLTL